MDWSEGDVEVDGGTLHWYRTGEGPTVVLAHGFSDNGRCWDRVARRLAERHDVVAYDARFHGLSAAGVTEGADGGSDLLAVVDGLGLDHPAVVGHSMGAGSAAAALAARPELFRAGVLEDPAWRPASPDESTDRTAAARKDLMGWIERVRTMPRDELLALARTSSPSWHEDELDAWADSKLQLHLPADAGAALGRTTSVPWQQQVARFTCPVLLVCGKPERGAIVTPGVAEEAGALSPVLEVTTLDAGHNVRREAFDDFVATVEAFLDRTLRTSGSPSP